MTALVEARAAVRGLAADGTIRVLHGIDLGLRAGKITLAVGPSG